MKKSTAKITVWIWRGAVLLFLIYFVVTAFVAQDQALKQDRCTQAAVLGYSPDIHGEYKGAALMVSGQEITLSPTSFCDSILYLHTDNLVLQDDIPGCNRVKLIGLNKPQNYQVSDDFLYSRSYASPFLPLIDTGESPFGMITLALLSIVISFLSLHLFPKGSLSSPKTIVNYGWQAKAVVYLIVLLFFEPSICWFYLTKLHYISWLTPIISIPALSIWLASFKNKKLAPLVALGIMVLCLYQPLANLICLFATVIAWGYFVEGIRRFFVRFRKVKAE